VDSDDLYYRHVTQSHSCLDPPKYWIYPLWEMLRNDQDASQIAENLEMLTSKLHICSYTLQDSSKGPTETQPRDYAGLVDVVLSSLYITTSLPDLDKDLLTPSHSNNTSFQGEPVSSLAKCKTVIVIENNVAHFVRLAKDESIEIEIKLQDGTLMRTCPYFKFLKIYPAGGWLEEMYLIEGLTGDCWQNHYINSSYPIKEILSTALDMYQNSHANLVKNSSAKLVPTVTFNAFSSKVKLSATVPDLGEFTLYQDGRCKVRFNDRAIVELCATNSGDPILSILDTHGNSTKIRLKNPVGFESYVDSIEQFLEFASGKTSIAQEFEGVQAEKNKMLEKIKKSRALQQKLDLLLK
jgi:hypothetical protein